MDHVCRQPYDGKKNENVQAVIKKLKKNENVQAVIKQWWWVSNNDIKEKNPP